MRTARKYFATHSLGITGLPSNKGKCVFTNNAFISPMLSLFVSQYSSPYTMSSSYLSIYRWNFIFLNAKAEIFDYPKISIIRTVIKVLLCTYISCLSFRLTSISQRAQISCLRFILRAGKFDHISPIFDKSSWLKMRQRWILHLCCLVYKILSSRVPSYLHNLIRRY